MRKIFFISILLLLSACSTNLYNSIFGEYIPKEIINSQCDLTPDGIYVMQVLDNGVLGKPVKYYYEKGIKTDSFERPDINSPTIYVSVRKDDLKNKFDDAAFSIAEDSCLTADGVYSYTTILGSKKSVQKFKIAGPRYVSNPNFIKN